MSADLTDEQRQKLEALKTKDESTATPVTTAFLVVQHADGQWAAFADYENLDLLLQRRAHLDDFVAGAANIESSCVAQQTAIRTLAAMNQQAQAMQAQMESQKIASQLDLSHLRK